MRRYKMFRKFAAQCARTAVVSSKNATTAYITHIKPAIKSSVEITRNIGTEYVKVSAYGAAAGGAVCAAASGILTLPTFFDGAEYSKAATFPGKMVDGFESVGRLWVGLVVLGMCVGGAPVTYPVFKLCTHVMSDVEEEKKPAFGRGFNI
jgi:hypothetical protein